MTRRWSKRGVAAGLIVTLVALLSVVGNTRLEAPPRFDGAGYAVLARAIMERRGYREIDRPDAPRHAHFPPGYPLALAGLWQITGRSLPAAHVFSAVCTLFAVVAGWLWFRRMYAPRVACLLGLALACNWTWGRTGSVIQSEPLYLLFGQSAILCAASLRSCDARRAKIPEWAFSIGLGALLASATLTRHVGASLALAILIDLIAARRLWPAVIAGAVAAAGIAPWAVWLGLVHANTQPGLLVRANLADQARHQAVFYMQRLPDAWTGPFVEIATVFRNSGSLRNGLNLWAAAVSLAAGVGWLLTLRTSRRRLAGLIAATSFPLLLVWPFTEAGRFLIPLVPVLLVGLVEGFARGLAAFSPRHARTWAAGVVLAASLPYSAYAVATSRSAAREAAFADFDAACAWLATRSEPPGPVLSRHPGEVYWLSGRTGVNVEGETPEAIETAIRRYHVAYLLIDEERYAHAPVSALARFAATRPERVREVWSRSSARSAVRIEQVVPDPRADRAGDP